MPGLVTIIALGDLVAAVLGPEPMRGLLAKEGPAEQVSHVVLAVAVIAWSARAMRPVSMRGGRMGAAALALAFAFVLGEELDWGLAFEVHVLADPLIRLVGRPDLHNAWGGASYLLFSLPVLAVVALGVAGPTDRAGWRGPSRGDAIALVLVAIAAVITIALPRAWEAALDELTELLAYVALAAAALRPGRGRSCTIA